MSSPVNRILLTCILYLVIQALYNSNNIKSILFVNRYEIIDIYKTDPNSLGIEV